MELYNKILNGYNADKNDLISLIDCDLDTLCHYANKLRIHFCGNFFDICTIINGKSGKCSENCKYCAQSAHYNTKCHSYPLLSTDEIKRDAKYNELKGIMHYSVVTSGKKLSRDETEAISNTYKEISSSCKIRLCASHGLLDFSELEMLKKSGITRYHNNIETSESYFPEVCTTHTQADKIKTIKAAQAAGLEVCSGGIMGLGETMEDRIDMALQLRSLNVVSVPINILNPIKNTPFENNKILSPDEIRRITAVFRFALPDKIIKIAGGRGLLADKGRSLFVSGANGAISGDMLTTAGVTINDDFKMLKELGYELP